MEEVEVDKKSASTGAISKWLLTDSPPAAFDNLDGEKSPPGRPLNGTPFPNLRSAVKSAETIRLKSGYDFRLFPFGERGNLITPAVIREIRAGLADEARSYAPSCDAIVTVQPGGTGWGYFLADAMDLPLKIITIYKSSPEDQTQGTQKHGYAKRRLYFPPLQRGERVILFDDVLSSGSTIRTIVNTLRQRCSVEVAVVLCIATMTKEVDAISRELGIPLHCLVSASEQ